MSIRVMTAVWEMTDLTATEKLVLLKLADCANDEGGHAYPSIGVVAQAACISIRAVQYTLRGLQARGFLAVERPPGPRTPTMYRLVLPVKVEVQPTAPLADPGVHDAAPRGASGSTRGVQPIAPDPSEEIRQKNHQSRARARGAPPEAEQEPEQTVTQMLWSVHEQLAGTLVPSTSDERQFEAWERQGCTAQHIAAARAAILEWNPDRPWAAFKRELGLAVARGHMPAAGPPPEDPEWPAIVARLRAEGQGGS